MRSRCRRRRRGRPVSAREPGAHPDASIWLGREGETDGGSVSPRPVELAVAAVEAGGGGVVVVASARGLRLAARGKGPPLLSPGAPREGRGGAERSAAPAPCAATPARAGPALARLCRPGPVSRPRCRRPSPPGLAEVG